MIPGGLGGAVSLPIWLATRIYRELQGAKGSVVPFHGVDVEPSGLISQTTPLPWPERTPREDEA